MSRTNLLATALGAVLLAAPALISPAAAECASFMDAGDASSRVADSRAGFIVLAQEGGSGSGAGISSSTPGSPGVGSAGSTPRDLGSSALQPGQGAATDLSGQRGGTDSTVGRGAPAPGFTNPDQVGSGSTGTTSPAVIQPGRTTGSGTTNR